MDIKKINNPNGILTVSAHKEHEVVQRFFHDCKQGVASLQAPSPGVKKKWTQEQIEALEKVLAEYYPG
jgi:hypothetical protein